MAQIDAVLKSNLIVPLVKCLSDVKVGFDIKKEAAWAISNALSGGNYPQIRFLVQKGVIGPLCNLFSCTDTKIVLVALEGIKCILCAGATHSPGKPNKYVENVEATGGLDKLEEVLQHENVEVYKKQLH
eukprot:TRINITY_DN11163_c0_g1_i1.p1 TRINITY_DN11163_c0_g1~~TRINITY_DN11163_c0_g1_i1.p1  ORF type:complete len:129 (+),score=27.32 TRINITY_DN11163_c0_g1_i1:121-507(+)